MLAIKPSLRVRKQYLQYTSKFHQKFHLSYFIRRSPQDRNTGVCNHTEHEALKRNKKTFLFVQTNLKELLLCLQYKCAYISLQTLKRLNHFFLHKLHINLNLPPKVL